MIRSGFKAPWNKDGWSTQEEADKEHKKIVARKVDYERLAAIYARILEQQADILRRKQLEVKKRKGGEVPKHLEITKDDLEFLLKAHREILSCMAFMQKVKVEGKKKTRDSFVDPRGDEGQHEEPSTEVEGGWEADGRSA